MSHSHTLGYWLRRYYARHSGKNRFVQNGYLRKTKNHVKENWRELKGFARDQAKIQGNRRDGCPPWLKRQCNKSYRRWTKDLINNERFDELCWRKDFYDPWLWD